MSPQAVTTCMSGADASLASLIHPPMHLKYFISHEREKKNNKKERTLLEGLNPGQGQGAQAQQQDEKEGSTSRRI